MVFLNVEAVLRDARQPKDHKDYGGNEGERVMKNLTANGKEKIVQRTIVGKQWRERC
ncbi:hypothetical protein CLOSTMETH_00367 [[Clostridium] methylpentosum DSM 5476]|uniref:Uncharacterized protein n=1 Tax=[Clostridium] methylpentosum DSM 5476 TaxID=537013 RepID=C0E969_9FIRM|nr:hypothetical protein CLOSTMETH_00367 [[Clostridium] methylpentosum DSM 5476]